MALRKFALDASLLTVARVFQAITTVLALPILARLLHPSDFGLMAVANSVLYLANVLADAGFGNSLVRTDFQERAIWSSVFWVTLVWSALLSLLVLALAVPAGWLLREPDVPPLVATMAIIPLGFGVLAAPTADLQQRNRFDLISLSDILGSIAGVIAVIVFAYAGSGAWALVAQSLTALLVKAVVILRTTRFRPLFVFDRHIIHEHLHFARNTGAFALTLFLAAQMDTILIARFVGNGPLGIYSMANRINAMPMIITTSLGALYPRLVKLQNDKQAICQIVLITTMVMSIVIFPPMAILIAAGRSVFTVVLSDRWSELAPVFAYMAPVGALMAVTGIHVSVLMAIGRTDARLRLSLEHSIVWLVALILAVHFGIRAVALAMLLSYVVYYPRLLYIFLSPIGGSVVEYLRVLILPFLVSAAVALAHVLLRNLVALDSLQETGLAFVEGMITYALLGLIMWGRVYEAFATMRTLITRADSSA